MGRRSVWWKRRLRLFGGDVPAPTFSEVTSTSARLSWEAVADAVTYTLQRGSATSTEWATIYITPSGLTYVDSGLEASTSYLYRLGVTNAAGTPSYSPGVLVTTTDDANPPPTPPIGPVAVQTGTTAIDLDLPVVAGATRYILQQMRG